MSIRLKYNNPVQTWFNLTLNDKYVGTITTGLTYSFEMENITGTQALGVIDYSPYPDVYNRFFLTTQLSGTPMGGQNFTLEQGWYKYKVYTWADRNTKLNLLEFGQCYVYDNDITPGNIPDNTETYIETKDKFIYQR